MRSFCTKDDEAASLSQKNEWPLTRPPGLSIIPASRGKLPTAAVVPRSSVPEMFVDDRLCSSEQDREALHSIYPLSPRLFANSENAVSMRSP